jgi:hypothetical protein
VVEEVPWGDGKRTRWQAYLDQRLYVVSGPLGASPFVEPRRRNLWVTDTLQWAPEARLAQPANPMWDSAASAFRVRSQLPFELVCPLR